jgi:hypothetical protein
MVWMLLILIFGIISLIIGILGYRPDLMPDFTSGLVDRVGNWYLWGLLGGPFLVILGGYYVSDGIKKRKELNELINSTSKAKFLKNRARIEELALSLTNKHEQLVIQKLQEFKIRR